MATPDELAAAFVAAWPARAVAPTGLGVRLAALCAAAEQGHRAIPIDDRALIAAIAARAPAAELDDYLARCRAADLWLAVAAAGGSHTAISEIERLYRGALDIPARRFAGPSHTADDLRQILRTKLFVAEPGAAPKIADFSGQGHLENWLRVTAVRLFLDLGKRKDRTREELAGNDEVLALPEPGDLALDVIKAEYRNVVAVAMFEAAHQLEPGDRHLLRQHLVGGLSIDQLGAVLGIHRATAARRIARAKESLVVETRRRVAERLGLDGGELDEVIGLVISRLDVSIVKLLASTREAG